MSLVRRLSAIQASLLVKNSSPLIIEFKGWMPDRADLANPGEIEANGVLPTRDGYSPFKRLANTTAKLDARCQGAGAAQNTAGVVTVYAGDISKLYSIENEAATDRSKSGGYTVGADETVEFTQFGNSVIATQITDPVQTITVGGTVFADMITGSEKPKARHVATVRDQLVLGNIVDSGDGTIPNRVWWSALRDITDFDKSATTLCDVQDIQAGGWVQRIIGNQEYGLVFLERQIQRMVWEGAPRIWDFVPVDRQRGTPIPGSVIAIGRLAFFISEEGFFVNDGTQSVPIGNEKVDREFWNQFDTTYISRVSAVLDPVRKVVGWLFPGTGNSGTPNKMFLYNWVEDRWSEADVGAQLVFDSISQGLSLDDLDTISTDLDALAFSLDSRAWTGGELKRGAFADAGGRGTLAFFTGADLDAAITPGERQLHPGQVSRVTNTRPLIEAPAVGTDVTVTVQVAGRARQLDIATFGSAASMTTIGECPVINEARFQRFRTNITTGDGLWTHAQGIQIDSSPAGQI